MKKIEEEKQIILLKDIPYLGKEDASRLDAWLPGNSGEQRAAWLLLHGGGWTTGDKGDQREENMARDLCALGYAVFSANYHMARYAHGPYQGERLSCAWPGCIADSMDAISYIRRNAPQFSVDPDRIGCIGSSAGGHLALLLATAAEDTALNRYRRYQETPCTISCAVSLYGVPDILSWGGELLMPEPYETSQAEWKLASPAGHLDRKPCPILLIHGDADETVPVEESVRFYQLLKNRGYTAELLTVHGGKHSFDFSALTKGQLKKAEEFFDAYLGKERIRHE